MTLEPNKDSGFWAYQIYISMVLEFLNFLNFCQSIYGNRKKSKIQIHFILVSAAVNQFSLGFASAYESEVLALYVYV